MDAQKLLDTKDEIEMVFVEGGSFMMGSNDGNSNEKGGQKIDQWAQELQTGDGEDNSDKLMNALYEAMNNHGSKESIVDRLEELHEEQKRAKDPDYINESDRQEIDNWDKAARAAEFEGLGLDPENPLHEEIFNQIKKAEKEKIEADDEKKIVDFAGKFYDKDSGVIDLDALYQDPKFSEFRDALSEHGREILDTYGYFGYNDIKGKELYQEKHKELINKAIEHEKQSNSEPSINGDGNAQRQEDGGGSEKAGKARTRKRRTQSRPT